MSEEIIEVKKVGIIKPPVSVPAKTPEEAAKGESTVTMVFPNPVVLTVDHGNQIAYPKGTHEVPRRLADHWYLAAHGARLYNAPVAAGGGKGRNR